MITVLPQIASLLNSLVSWELFKPPFMLLTRLTFWNHYLMLHINLQHLSTFTMEIFTVETHGEHKLLPPCLHAQPFIRKISKLPHDCYFTSWKLQFVFLEASSLVKKLWIFQIMWFSNIFLTYNLISKVNCFFIKLSPFAYVP